MRDRISTKILGNGAARYGVYDEDGNLLRYEYIKLEDEPDEEGTILNKANLLTDETAALLGLEQEDPTVNEAFRQISTTQAGTGTLYVYCKDESGEPVSGCVVQIGEELAVTGASGVVKYFLAPGTHSVIIRSPIDYGAEAQTKSVTVALGGVASLDATIQDSLNGAKELRLTSSLAGIAFSACVASADVFGVSGGGSGGVALRFDTKNLIAKASGGAGGRTKTVLSVDLLDVFKVTVGAGGASVSNKNVFDPVDGKSGGTTSVIGLRSGTLLSLAGGTGGAAGQYSYNNTNSATGASGGSGSGAAGNSSVGASGSDGASGGSVSQSVSGSTYNLAGGSGQGNTTRAFGEPSGELFASAGGSVLATNTPIIGTVGEGGVLGVAQFVASSVTTVSLVGNDATTIGGGGGAVAAVSYNENPTSVSLTSGAGKAGIVIFRWEVV